MEISYQCSCERYGIRLIKLPMKGTELDYIYCVKNNIIELKNGIQISTSNEKTNIVLEKLKE